MAKCVVASCWLVSAWAGLAPAAGPAWVPKDLPGCVWWIAADAGVMTNARGEVTKWLDQSGQGHDIDQAAGKPPRMAQGLNGRPVVRFEPQGCLFGSHDFSSRSLAAHSLFLLARWTDSAPACCQRILSSHTWNWTFGYMEGHDQSWFEECVDLSGGLERLWRRLQGTPSGICTPARSPRGQVRWPASGKTTRSLWSSGPKPAPTPPGCNRGRSELNGLCGSNQTSKCEIAEAILFSRVLSEAELNQVWRYFARKYRIDTPASPAPRGPAGAEEDRLLRQDCRGTLHPRLAVVQAVRVPPVVPRREVRHLGPLESAVPARAGRLVRLPHVPTGQPRLPVPRRALRPSLAVSATRTFATCGRPRNGTPTS